MFLVKVKVTPMTPLSCHACWSVGLSVCLYVCMLVCVSVSVSGPYAIVNLSKREREPEKMFVNAFDVI